LKELFLGLLILQALTMLVDEFYFHHKRGLGLWESLGHPLDTLTVIAAFSIILFFPATGFFKAVFIGLSIFSCIFVTKDEFVHQKLCSWQENMTHAILFMVHPVLFIGAFYLWSNSTQQNFLFGMTFKDFLKTHLFVLSLFMLYQLLYWNRTRFYGFIKN
jgi:hypothetical protein